MLKLYSFEGKTQEEALEKALSNLNASTNEVIYNITETEGKLFKAKKSIVNVVLKNDVKNEIKDFINELKKKMNIDINMEVKEVDDVFNVLLISDNNSILIGKEGRTINALQLILRQTLNKYGLNIKVNLDVSNYKANKVKNIEYEIKKLARNVLDTKVEAKLDPMNSYERRVVHTVISEFEFLETESFGEEPERYVIIRYKED
ncbi:MAG: KH domain-containing protein [Firmicutes bacterium]|nr:KH domain-containing protein [Bacillota bacterium]